MIDVTQQISAVRRRVGSRTIEPGEARVVTISQTYDASLDDVWDACTNAERIPRWFLPITGDLTLHGRYQLEGNAGGVIERCDPPKGFAATWEYGEELSWIEVRLTSEPDGRTRFELDHIGHTDEDRWAEFGPGAVGIGWDMSLMALYLHLSSSASMDPEQATVWMMSDEGREFMTASSEDWYRAAVASGADEAAARAAADRCTAAYTAAPE